jgi:hypothetical protein
MSGPDFFNASGQSKAVLSASTARNTEVKRWSRPTIKNSLIGFSIFFSAEALNP